MPSDLYLLSLYLWYLWQSNDIYVVIIPFFTYKRFNLESLRNVVKSTPLVNGRAWAQGWVFPSNSFQSRWSFSVVLLSVNLICMLRLLPLAAVSNYCRLGGLAQQKWIVSQFWRPEMWSQHVGQAVSPAESVRRFLLHLFQIQVVTDVPWLVTAPSDLCLCLHRGSSFLCLSSSIWSWSVLLESRPPLILCDSAPQDIPVFSSWSGTCLCVGVWAPRRDFSLFIQNLQDESSCACL